MAAPGIEMHLQSHVRGAGLDGILDQVEDRPHQGVAVAQQLTGMAIALPANRQTLHMRLGRRLKRLHEHFGGDSVGQRQFASGENQHVAHLMLQLVQPLFQTPGEALLRGHGQLLFGQVTGVKQGGGQRRADLMRQGRDHPPQGRQAFMPGQLVLQVTGFSQVVEQHQLARLGIQRAGRDRQAPTVLEGDFMPVVLTRRKAAGNHLAPQLAFQGQTQQLTGRRIGFAHDALGVNDDDATGQQIKEVLQAVGQAFFFRQFLHALGADHFQLALELGHPGFEHAVGVSQLARHLVEQRKRLLKTQPAGLLYGRQWPRSIRDRRHLGGLGHRALSLG